MQKSKISGYVKEAWVCLWLGIERKWGDFVKKVYGQQSQVTLQDSGGVEPKFLLLHPSYEIIPTPTNIYIKLLTVYIKWIAKRQPCYISPNLHLSSGFLSPLHDIQPQAWFKRRPFNVKN